MELLPPQSVSLFTSVVKMSVWPFNETSFANYFSVLSNLGNENRVACLLAVVLVSEVDKEIIVITDFAIQSSSPSTDNYGFTLILLIGQ